MGEEDNFTVDPMNGRIILQVRRIRKNKLVSSKVEMLLEKVEEKWEKRREEEESEIDMISNLDFPSFDDEEQETEEEIFQRGMRDFKRVMERKKEQWREKMEEIKKEKIKWIWTCNDRDKFKGIYEGEVKD